MFSSNEQYMTDSQNYDAQNLSTCSNISVGWVDACLGITGRPTVALAGCICCGHHAPCSREKSCLDRNLQLTTVLRKCNQVKDTERQLVSIFEPSAPSRTAAGNDRTFFQSSVTERVPNRDNRSGKKERPTSQVMAWPNEITTVVFLLVIEFCSPHNILGRVIT